MNVLVIGSGGREHALTWKIAQSPLVGKMYCAPGNPGMAQLAECVDIGVNEFGRLMDFSLEREIGLAVVGPEDPLVGGIVDDFAEMGLRAFGPQGAAARLEGSKAFAKDLMARYNIPTAAHEEFDDADKAIAYVKSQGAPIVVKADGLAAGKGVTVARDVDEAIQAIEEAMVGKVFGDAGAKVIVEECLVGEEASILALTDGEAIVTLPPAQDHKAAYDGDEGPNTGGMGAYSPAPVVTEALFKEIEERILRPCIGGLAEDGHTYSGVLYAGLMITESGPKVIEFNCRFGDPEAQVVLPRIKTDIVPLLVGCCDGALGGATVETDKRACVSVAMASGGYPKAYKKGKVIRGIEEAESAGGVIVFHAGTKMVGEDLVTNGGRVLNVTALGDDIPASIERAYGAVKKIDFEDAHIRTDIGQKAINRIGH